MAIDFKPLSMTELRTRPGEILDRVAEDGEAFIIERNGRQTACLVPLSVFLPDISPARIASELDELSKAGIEASTTVTADREVSIKVRSEGTSEDFSITIFLPHHYPNACPRVYVDPVDPNAPHRFADGALCIFGVMTSWNPGKNSVRDAVDNARRWLRRYEAWRSNGSWPYLGVDND
jgi:prevent-host-death family protein